MTRRLAPVLSTLALSLLLATASDAQTYTVTDLGALGTYHTFPYGINDATRITGVSYVPANPGNIRHGFLWENGQMTDIGTLVPGGYTWPADINEAGHITGFADDATGYAQPFLYANGTLTDLMIPNDGGEARGMNNLDQVAGYAYDFTGPGNLFGFVHTPGVGFEYLPPLSTNMYADAMVEGINDRGLAVGLSTGDATGVCQLNSRATAWTKQGAGWVAEDLGLVGNHCSSHAWDVNEIGQVVGSTSGIAGDAVMWQKNGAGQWTVKTLGSLGGLTTIPYAINNRVQVVGKSNGRAFLWQCGKMTDLNTLIPAGSGWVLSSAQDINDLGEITGYGTLNGGDFRGFLLKPSRYNTCCRETGVVAVDPLPQP